MDGSLSSAHRSFQTRTLEWVAISASRGSSQGRDRIHISCIYCIGRQILYPRATWKAPTYVLILKRCVWVWGPALNGGCGIEHDYVRVILLPPDAKNWLIGKDPDSGKDWGQEENGTTEDEKVGWHHWLNGHERPGVLQSMKLQRVRHDWATEVNVKVFSIFCTLKAID